MAGHWQWVIGAATGGHSMALTQARERRVTWRLAAPSEASFNLDGRHPEAAAIDELATDLHVIRDQQILYRGRAGATGDELTADSHDMSVASLDYREILNRRIAWVDLTYTSTDEADIVKGLINHSQGQPGGDLGITVATAVSNGFASATGTKRDRTYEAGDSIGQRIQELSEVIGGFDWDVHPTDDASASALTLDLYKPQRGADRGVVLEYGGALVSTISRQVDPGDYANAIRVTGTEPKGGGGAPAPQTRESSTVTTDPQGRWEAGYGTSITTLAALQQRADWQLADAETIIPSYVVTLAADAWRGPGHIWLGDTVRLRIKSGRLSTDVALRVSEVSATIDDDGGEHITLAVGRPDTRLYRIIPRMLRRISTLERR